MHTAGISYLQHHHNHNHHQQQQQQSSHSMPTGSTAVHTLSAGPPAQQPLSSQVPASHSNSVVQVYSTLPHMAGGGVEGGGGGDGGGGGGGGGGELHTLGLQPFHPVLVSQASCLLTPPSGRTRQFGLTQVPSQCVESQSFTTPPVYGPGKQGTKTKICSLTNNLTELGEKVIIPKRQRNSKKSPDGPTGDGEKE